MKHQINEILLPALARIAAHSIQRDIEQGMSTNEATEKWVGIAANENPNIEEHKIREAFYERILSAEYDD